MPSAVITPTDNFELTVTGDYSRKRSDNTPSINVSPPNKFCKFSMGFCPMGAIKTCAPLPGMFSDKAT